MSGKKEGSKGGHSAYEPRPKVMVDILDNIIDLNDIKRIERKNQADPDNEETGIAYVIHIHFFSYPYDQFHKFKTEEQRDEAILKYKAKMLQTGIVVL